MAAVVGDLLMTLLLSTLEGVECTLDTYPGVNGISSPGYLNPSQCSDSGALPHGKPVSASSAFWSRTCSFGAAICPSLGLQRRRGRVVSMLRLKNVFTGCYGSLHSKQSVFSVSRE